MMCQVEGVEYSDKIDRLAISSCWILPFYYKHHVVNSYNENIYNVTNITKCHLGTDSLFKFTG